jgi:hypothetical protein
MQELIDLTSSAHLRKRLPEDTVDQTLLLDENTIGPAVFAEPCPTPRAIRAMRKRGLIPFFKIGRFVRFDPRLVRAALEQKCLVNAKRK